MSVIADTSQVPIGPYSASASVGFVQYASRAVIRAARFGKVPGGGGDDGGGESGGGDDGGGDVGGGESSHPGVIVVLAPSLERLPSWR